LVLGKTIVQRKFKMTDKESSSLDEVFRDTVRSEFSFLEKSYGFSRAEPRPRTVRYDSAAVTVTIFHGRIFDLGVTIGLIPVIRTHNTCWSRLFKLISYAPGEAINENAIALSRDQASPYHLPSIIGALARQSDMAPSIRDRLENGALPVFAHDIDDVRNGIRELAALTRKYADPLLRGDLVAFKKVSEYAHLEGEIAARAMLLRELPSEMRDRLRLAPLRELYRARDEALKSRVLAEHPDEYRMWANLAPEEFSKRYFERKYPQVRPRR